MRQLKPRFDPGLPSPLSPLLDHPARRTHELIFYICRIVKQNKLLAAALFDRGRSTTHSSRESMRRTPADWGAKNIRCPVSVQPPAIPVLALGRRSNRQLSGN